MDEQQRTLAKVFLPYYVESRDRLEMQGSNFAHYTSVDAAIKIIDSQTVWLRNSLVMNDFMEVQHGQNCLRASWDDDELRSRMTAILEQLESGMTEKFLSILNLQQEFNRLATFMFSLSEHDSGVEEAYGRLSMWRAYGGNHNVALVLNTMPFFSNSGAINAMTSPVLYVRPVEFKKEFDRIVGNMEKNLGVLKNQSASDVLASLRFALTIYSLSLKHPGFAEEREWRVIVSPTLAHDTSKTERIEDSIEVIGGVAQRVKKIPLRDYPDEGFVGAELPGILKEIIIGPSANPWILQEAFIEKLRQHNVPDPHTKVRVSDIPLRR